MKSVKRNSRFYIIFAIIVIVVSGFIYYRSTSMTGKWVATSMEVDPSFLVNDFENGNTSLDDEETLKSVYLTFKSDKTGMAHILDDERGIGWWKQDGKIDIGFEAGDTFEFTKSGDKLTGSIPYGSGVYRVTFEKEIF